MKLLTIPEGGRAATGRRFRSVMCLNSGRSIGASCDVSARVCVLGLLMFGSEDTREHRTSRRLNRVLKRVCAPRTRSAYRIVSTQVDKPDTV